MTDKAKMHGLLVSAGYSAKEIREFRNMDSKLDKRETATVLAALRDLNWHRDDCNVKEIFPELFADCELLSVAEIDALCERLNFA